MDITAIQTEISELKCDIKEYVALKHPKTKIQLLSENDLQLTQLQTQLTQLQTQLTQLQTQLTQLQEKELILLRQQESQQDILQNTVKSKKRKIPELEDAPNFQLFWNSLTTINVSKCSFKNAETDEDSSYDFLNFTECLQDHKVPFLGDSTITNKIFVRKCYEDLSALIFQNKRFLLTGNPGIGKSVFLIYLLYQIRQKEPSATVVLHRQKDSGLIYVFTPDSVKTTGNLRDVDGILAVSTNYYLLDTINPGVVEAKTIEVSSPRKEHYREFRKYSGTRHCFMPIWSLEELKCAMNQCFATKVTSQQLYERYELIGGIARFIFDKDTEQLMQEIDTAISKTDLSSCLKSVGEIDSKEDDSHVLIHVIPEEGYEKRTVQFASIAIVEKVISKLDEQKYLDMIEFLKSCTNDRSGCASSMFGQIFEVFCHKILLKGGDYDIKNLRNGETSKLTINSSASVIIFTDTNEITDVNTYYKPKSKTYAAVDSIQPIVGFFQMTVSKSHPIAMNKMKKLVDNLHVTSKIYFVVPEGYVFDEFQEQNFLTAKGTKAINVSQQLKDLEQLALSIRFKKM